MVVLASRFPESAAARNYAKANAAVSLRDGPVLALKKALKVTASREPLLGWLLRLIRGAERIRLPDPALDRVYAALAGLYIFRGFRSVPAPSEAT